jgi:large subunit ribosomal protein L17
MRHRKAHRKLGRPTDQRMALLKSLVSSVLWYGAIETTEVRAKEARPLVEQMITLARVGDVESRRQAARFLATGGGGSRSSGGYQPPAGRVLVKRLFQEIGPVYKDRAGGYTRIIRTRLRRGDAAEMARLELVDFPAR